MISANDIVHIWYLMLSILTKATFYYVLNAPLTSFVRFWPDNMVLDHIIWSRTIRTLWSWTINNLEEYCKSDMLQDSGVTGGGGQKMEKLNGNFLPGKTISRREKIRKMTLPPQKNFPVTPLLQDHNWNQHCSRSMVAICFWSSVDFKYGPGAYLT